MNNLGASDGLVLLEWRILIDSAEREMSNAVADTREKYWVTGTIKSGPAIKGVHQTAAACLDGLISEHLKPYLAEKPPAGEVAEVRNLIEQLALKAKSHVLNQAIFAHGYHGRTKDAVDQLCALLLARVEAVFARHDADMAPVQEPAMPREQRPLQNDSVSPVLPADTETHEARLQALADALDMAEIPIREVKASHIADRWDAAHGIRPKVQSVTMLMSGGGKGGRPPGA